MSISKLLIGISLAVLTIGCRNQQPDAPSDSPREPQATSGDSDIQADLDLNDLAAVRNRAAAWMGQFKYDAAAKLYMHLASSQPADDELKVDLAIAMLNRRLEGDLMRAAKMLDHVLGTAPQNLRAKYCRALLYFHEGETDDAQRLFEEVANADPHDSYPAYYVGQCELSRGNYAKALARFEQALQVDPQLRSAYYGAFQAAQRLSEPDRARESLRLFQRLETNPKARLAELKYTRMGPKAEVSRPVAAPVEVAVPDGPVFAPASRLPIEGASSISWAAADLDARPEISVGDCNGDGQYDLLVISAVIDSGMPPRNVVLLQTTDGYRMDEQSPLAGVTDLQAALWGDYDDDGLPDVYLCRRGPNQLWRQTSPGEWADVTESTRTASGDFDTVDGACYDADHDGDLDFLLVNADGPNELLNNNRDGTFRPLGTELGLQQAGDSSQQIIVADLDADDDADLIFLSAETPHAVLRNDRLWEYGQARGFDEFAVAEISAALAVDADVDGQVEIYAVGPQQLQRWQPSDDGVWTATAIANVGHGEDRAAALAAEDFDGDTTLELAVQLGSQIHVLELDGAECQTLEDARMIGRMTPIIGPHGASLAVCAAGEGPLLWAAGSGRFPFALLQFSGRTDKGAEMRSSASGIGVRGAARIGTHWSPLETARWNSGPGQGLYVRAIGSGGAEKIDYIQVVWPDGVSQTELDLAVGKQHVIAETQRQAGSCPLVFVWNGERFEFIADVLGAGGIGFNLGRGEYYDPRPRENLLIPATKCKPRDGRLVVKLGEPMEEICYFDAIRMVAYDLPPGWQMALDERFGGADPQPTGEAIFFDSEWTPAEAINDRQQDVTSAVTMVDRIAAPLDRTDRRFIGMTSPHALTLTFDEPLDELAAPVLVFDGWVEYAYSQSAFAAWQAGAAFVEPTIEAQGEDGQWHAVFERFGYMAGTPRRSAVPLARERLPVGTRKLRLSTNMQIYWDRLAVVDAAANKAVRRQDLKLLKAAVDDVGFSQRTLFEQRYPIYDYDDRPPLGDARHPRGFYTAFGDALPLVRSTDDAMAIIGPGEELHLEYAEPPIALPVGWRRYYVLESDGWCKDGDLFTKDSRTVKPLPTRGEPLRPEQSARREQLHQRYNTRYRSGW